MEDSSRLARLRDKLGYSLRLPVRPSGEALSIAKPRITFLLSIQGNGSRDKETRVLFRATSTGLNEAPVAESPMTLFQNRQGTFFLLCLLSAPLSAILTQGRLQNRCHRVRVWDDSCWDRRSSQSSSPTTARFASPSPAVARPRSPSSSPSPLPSSNFRSRAPGRPWHSG